MSWCAQIVARKKFSKLSPEEQSKIISMATRWDDLKIKVAELNFITMFPWHEGYDENKSRLYRLYNEEMISLADTLGSLMKSLGVWGCPDV